MTLNRLFTCFVLLLFFGGCNYDYYADRDSTKIYTEAKQYSIGYMASEGFSIGLSDPGKDLGGLRIIPSTAYLWNTESTYPLVAKQPDIAYNSRIPRHPDDTIITSITFYLQVENPQAKQIYSVIPLKPGVYNISIQFNGAAGVHTFSGTFAIKRKQTQFMGPP